MAMAARTGMIMAQATETMTAAIMRTDHILILTQWLSPAYPVGAFAYSHGLEWAVQAGDVRDRATLQDWLDTVVRFGAGWSDAVFLVAAFNAGDALQIDAQVRAFAASCERLQETTQQGAAFASAAAAVWDKPVPPLCYPVAVGHAARMHDLPLDLTVQMFTHAVMANLVSAGMRLMPLGQSEGQRIIAALTPVCQGVAIRALDATLDDLTSTAFIADIAAMRHETQRSRIFRT